MYIIINKNNNIYKCILVITTNTLYTYNDNTQMHSMHKSTHDRPLTGVCPLADPQGAGAGVAGPKVTRVRAHASRTEERGSR